MRKKILKIEMILLFFISILSGVFFFLEDKIPDNYFAISSRTGSPGFVSYYLTSLLAIIGKTLGVWVVVPFIVFLFIYSFVLSKREYKLDVVNVFFIYTFFGLFLFMAYPVPLGEGLRVFLKQHFDFLSAFILFVLIGVSFYFLTFKKWNISWVVIKKQFLCQYNYYTEKLKTKLDFVSEKFMFWRKFKKENLVNTEKLSSTNKNVSASKTIFLEGPTSISENSGEDVYQYEQMEMEIDEEMPNLDLEESSKNQRSGKTVPEKQKDYSLDIKTLINCLIPQKQSKKNFVAPDDTYFSDIITRLEEKLGEFKLDVKVMNILKGPVVDTFELELGAGVKVSRITSITEDLSLALCGLPIRMVYPMKGKSTVGVEIPRNPREIIFLDEILSYSAYKDSQYKLPLAMGKNAFGEMALVDLASMPHMLVAGSTGSGKSVFVNALLVSLLIKLSPSKLKLILIDPKQLELALYGNVPHLMMPVVTDAKAASLALLWACQEMERRYSVLKELGVRNLEGFNERFKSATEEQIKLVSEHYNVKDSKTFELPYLVIIVDEFADLILTKMGKDIEGNICRLAAKARAAGIHLVVATQRPSVDVITGLIKSNFPTRVSFRVTSSIDSRTILNAVGAEKLLGRGDMLYKHGIDVERLHSAFVDENEIEVLVKKLAEIPPDFDEEAMNFIENAGENESDSNIGNRTSFDTNSSNNNNDDLFDSAVKVVVEYQMASASMLQRRLRIGYNRAANLVEEMESKGIIGPQEGSRPRKVLITSSENITS